MRCVCVRHKSQMRAAALDPKLLSMGLAVLRMAVATHCCVSEWVNERSFQTTVGDHKGVGKCDLLFSLNCVYYKHLFGLVT